MTAYGAIYVEAENASDIRQLENELEASINNSTHIEGDVSIEEVELL